jgi:ABC-type Mn2+/Zn2+ transport system ATPase subunit
MATGPAIEATGLVKRYDETLALAGVDLDVPRGAVLALLGPNGAGKTTFFKALVGLVPKETGEVTFGGHGKVGADKDIAYLPQRSVIDWDFPVTVRGMVEMGRYMRIGNWGRFGKTDDEAVDLALRTMDLTDLAERQISALSGGQQQRAFLARSLAQNAHVFLLDEPFTGLDKTAQDLLAQAIRKLVTAGNLVIASHHDLKSVPELFDQVIFLNGELIAFGDMREVFTQENIARTYRTHIFSGTHEHHSETARAT